MNKIEQTEVKRFDSLESELLLIKEENSKLIFDISTKAGKKDCKSHISKLRKFKKPIVESHKFLKADIVKYGKILDTRKRDLLKIIEDMIEFQSQPMKVIDDAEKAELEKKQLAIDNEIARNRKRELEDIGLKFNEDSRFFFYEDTVLWLEDVLKMDGETFVAKTMELKMYIKDLQCKDDKIRDEEIAKAKEDERTKVESEVEEKTKKLFGKDNYIEKVKEVFKAEDMEVVSEKVGPEINDSFLPNSQPVNSNKYGPSPVQTMVTLPAPIIVNEANFQGINKISKPTFQMEEVSIETKRRKNNEILSDLIQKLNMSDSYARNVIKAIFKGEIRNVRIEY